VRHLPSEAASGVVIEAAVRLLPSAAAAFLRVVRPSVPAVAIAAFRLVAPSGVVAFPAPVQASA